MIQFKHPSLHKTEKIPNYYFEAARTKANKLFKFYYFYAISVFVRITNRIQIPEDMFRINIQIAKGSMFAKMNH